MAMMKYLRGLFPISLNIFFNNGYDNYQVWVEYKLNKTNLEKIETIKIISNRFSVKFLIQNLKVIRVF